MFKKLGTTKMVLILQLVIMSQLRYIFDMSRTAGNISGFDKGNTGNVVLSDQKKTMLTNKNVFMLAEEATLPTISNTNFPARAVYTIARKILEKEQSKEKSGSKLSLTSFKELFTDPLLGVFKYYKNLAHQRTSHNPSNKRGQNNNGADSNKKKDMSWEKEIGTKMLGLYIENPLELKPKLQIFQGGDSRFVLFKSKLTSDKKSYYKLAFATGDTRLGYNDSKQISMVGISEPKNLLQGQFKQEEDDENTLSFVYNEVLKSQISRFEVEIETSDLILMGNADLFDNIPLPLLNILVNYVFYVMAQTHKANKIAAKCINRDFNSLPAHQKRAIIPPAETLLTYIINNLLNTATNNKTKIDKQKEEEQQYNNFLRFYRNLLMKKQNKMRYKERVNEAVNEIASKKQNSNEKELDFSFGEANIDTFANEEQNLQIIDVISLENSVGEGIKKKLLYNDKVIKEAYKTYLKNNEALHEEDLSNDELIKRIENLDIMLGYKIEYKGMDNSKTAGSRGLNPNRNGIDMTDDYRPETPKFGSIENPKNKEPFKNIDSYRDNLPIIDKDRPETPKFVSIDSPKNQEQLKNRSNQNLDNIDKMREQPKATSPSYVIDKSVNLFDTRLDKPTLPQDNQVKNRISNKLNIQNQYLQNNWVSKQMSGAPETQNINAKLNHQYIPKKKIEANVKSKFIHPKTNLTRLPDAFNIVGKGYANKGVMGNKQIDQLSKKYNSINNANSQSELPQIKQPPVDKQNLDTGLGYNKLGLAKPVINHTQNNGTNLVGNTINIDQPNKSNMLTNASKPLSQQSNSGFKQVPQFNPKFFPFSRKPSTQKLNPIKLRKDNKRGIGYPSALNECDQDSSELLNIDFSKYNCGLSSLYKKATGSQYVDVNTVQLDECVLNIIKDLSVEEDTKTILLSIYGYDYLNEALEGAVRAIKDYKQPNEINKRSDASVLTTMIKNENESIETNRSSLIAEIDKKLSELNEKEKERRKTGLNPVLKLKKNK